MGGSKPKPVQTPFQETRSTQNTFSPVSIRDTKEAEEFLGLPLNFGGNNYTGDAWKDYGNAYKDYSGQAFKDYSGNAYQDIKNDFTFNLDPGAGRRTALAEQGAANRWDNSLMAGVPAFLRQQAKQKELRDIRGQGAAEQQQAQYQAQNALQNAQYQSSLARAGMRDAAELNKARFRDESERTMASLRDASELNRAQGLNAAELERARMLDAATSARTAADLARRERLLPQVYQTGGTGSSSGYNTQIQPGQQGWFGSLLQGAGSAIGGLAAGGLI